MNPQDAANFTQWLQEILNTLRDTHTQLQDLRAENRQMMDDLRGIIARVDQKDDATLKIIDALKSQIDTVRIEASAAKTAAENAASTVDSRLNDIKSTLNDIKRSV